MLPNTNPSRLSIVREDSQRYELGSRYQDEGSKRSATGSVTIATDAEWRATLTVPLPASSVAFLSLERRGPLPHGYRGSEEAALFSMPVTEVDAALSVLTGVAAQARRDGVLPEA
jgi:hypothetical protein